MSEERHGVPPAAGNAPWAGWQRVAPVERTRELLEQARALRAEVIAASPMARNADRLITRLERATAHGWTAQDARDMQVAAEAAVTHAGKVADMARALHEALLALDDEGNAAPA